jgi:hypothetical protein
VTPATPAQVGADPGFGAIGEFHDAFRQTMDEELIEAFAAARRAERPRALPGSHAAPAHA